MVVAGCPGLGLWQAWQVVDVVGLSSVQSVQLHVMLGGVVGVKDWMGCLCLFLGVVLFWIFVVEVCLVL